MKDALSAEAASLPAPKAQWILAIQGEDMGCIISMEKIEKNCTFIKFVFEKRINEVFCYNY